jgi:hypothetical protein
MLRRCAAMLSAIDVSCAADIAPGSGTRWPNPASCSSPSVTARSWPVNASTMAGTMPDAFR